MQFNQIVTQRNAGRIARMTLLTMAVALSLVGALIAESLTKQREFIGKIFMTVYRKTPEGKWEEFDRIETNTRFTVSVMQLATGGKVESDYVWNGRTAKGHQASIRMAGPAGSKFNPATGELRLENLVFDVTVNGKKDRFSYGLTTDHLSTPVGAFSGKRARIAGGAAELAMVGKSVPKKTRLMDILDPVAGGRSGKRAGNAGQATEQRAGVTRGKNAGLVAIDLADEVMMVINGEGRLTAK
jgi:hypothetical protein